MGNEPRTIYSGFNINDPYAWSSLYLPPTQTTPICFSSAWVVNGSNRLNNVWNSIQDNQDARIAANSRQKEID